MDIKTPSGFSCKISEDVRDDMELLDDLTAVDRGDLSHMPDVIRRLLGDKGKAALYEFCRLKSGRVSSKKVMTEIKSIFDEIGKGKGAAKN